ncbi:unnamed protein product [Adineta steineri]|uniref:Uncharacterized protein n=1 Tax=Adineta steineri TaxID=433720 RepID=A0A815DK83_9BILA|nr:unnamed protein product [Adineta steineri]CAF4246241.1 unnamed protein product [Adineta steineri]
MKLREKNFPQHYWLKLHNHIIDELPAPPLIKHRNVSKTKINNCITSLVPHIQKFIYCGAIDKRKGEVRSTHLPLSSEQFNVLNRLEVTRKYQSIIPLEEQLQLQYDFLYKNYFRGINNIQFRLQMQKPVIVGTKSVLLLRIRFQQKPAVLKL